MKTRTYQQVETAKRRAEAFEANVLGDDDRAQDFADMSVEDYADLRGITIQNPNKQGATMPISITQLRRELREANDRISELEQERADVLDALGLEVIGETDEEEEEEYEET